MTSEVSVVDGVRERVLEAACELFAARGINSTGVDLVSEVAGVSKRSLYQRFPSKDHLIAAYLPRATDRFLDGLIPAEDSGLSPAECLVEVFAATREKSHAPDFRGCPVLNATAEIVDVEHPMRGVAVSYKDMMHGYFTARAEAAGAADPGLLAEQLVMLFDGAMAFSSVRGLPVPESVLVTVRTLLAAQGVSAER